MASTTTTSSFNVHSPKDIAEMIRLRDFRLLQREASTLLSQAVKGDQGSDDLSEDVGEYLVEDRVDNQDRVVLVQFDPGNQQLASVVTAQSGGKMLRVTQTQEGQTIEESSFGKKRTIVYNLSSGQVTETNVQEQEPVGGGPVRLLDSEMSINVHDPKTPAEMFLLRDFRKEQKTVHDWLATAVQPANQGNNLSETAGEYMCLDPRTSNRAEQVILVQFDPTDQDKLTNFRRSTHDEMHVCQPDPENPNKTLFEGRRQDWRGPGQRSMRYDPETGNLNYQVDKGWLEQIKNRRD
ncbi:MAG: hypothetical protein U0931_30220 [Vulcanimicrobiota bacterium]